MQKRKIKKQYAVALRKTKQSGQAVKKTGSIVTKAAQAVTRILRKNPVFLLKLGLLLLLAFSIMSLFTMCMSIFSGSGGFLMGAASYVAEESEIESAELAYTEWETDLQLEIANAETNHPDYDEYRYNVGSIGHDPFALMAYLTAVYGEFQYSAIASVLQGIFDAQYTLEFVPEVETRVRTVTKTGTRTNADDEEEEYEYEEDEEYEWHILNVNLASVPFTSIITPLMDSDQTEHYGVLTQTLGARQFGGSPFAIMNWIPLVSSNYGYRVHPVTGEKDLHRGIDIAMPQGTEIHAGITGTVTVSAFDSSYGNYIVIKSADGIEMKYAHCQTLYYSVGQTVTKGDVIATVGSTGTSTGAHLHMEILKNGIYLNPIYFVDNFYGG
jgi:murein DD-endopeptidase MepM/ murein hydrolase activator NlpD